MLPRTLFEFDLHRKAACILNVSPSSIIKARGIVCVSVCLCVCAHVRALATHTVAFMSDSLGKELVVYEISIHVLPTEPSPTTTNLRHNVLFAMATM